MTEETVAERKRGRPTAQERENRRDQVLDAAVRCFVAKGYGHASMDELAAAARVTKRTIYSYFGDKADVFTAAVERFRTGALEGFADPDEPIVDLSARIVFVLHSDEAVGLHRLMIAEAPQFPDLADRFYRGGPGGYVEQLAGRLSGGDRDVDGASRLAEAVFGLLLGEPHRRRLLGLSPAPTHDEARRHAVEVLSVLGIEERR